MTAITAIPTSFLHMITAIRVSQFILPFEHVLRAIGIFKNTAPIHQLID